MICPIHAFDMLFSLRVKVIPSYAGRFNCRIVINRSIISLVCIMCILPIQFNIYPLFPSNTLHSKPIYSSPWGEHTLTIEYNIIQYLTKMRRVIDSLLHLQFLFIDVRIYYRSSSYSILSNLSYNTQYHYNTRGDHLY